MGSDLASIHSEAEQALVTEVLRTQAGHTAFDAWLGLKRDAEGKTMKTSIKKKKGPTRADFFWRGSDYPLALELNIYIYGTRVNNKAYTVSRAYFALHKTLNKVQNF